MWISSKLQIYGVGSLRTVKFAMLHVDLKNFTDGKYYFVSYLIQKDEPLKSLICFAISKTSIL